MIIDKILYKILAKNIVMEPSRPYLNINYNKELLKHIEKGKKLSKFKYEQIFEDGAWRTVEKNKNSRKN